MSEVLPPPSVLRFGAFEADLRAGELRKRRRKIRLQEKPFQVLAALLQRPGEVVTREELREKLWPAETFVEFDDNINTAISRVREALGDTAEHPHFVETLPRHGYRFIAAVESTDEPSRPAAGLRLIWIAGLAFLALVVAAFALNVGQWRERLFGTGSSSIRSLAVLPLENLSSDPEQDYFADGMTEALITELGKISAL
ncbi:MAG: winged helix-turn-helix domain-containing protein [Phycisphaerae bacterium]|jgi:DNA-binding winged helix-turn-helix (wHTH) protein